MDNENDALRVELAQLVEAARSAVKDVFDTLTEDQPPDAASYRVGLALGRLSYSVGRASKALDGFPRGTAAAVDAAVPRP
jgi:hypothetical protein